MMHFDSHLSGVGEVISLTDLLQLFHYCRKSVLLHVSGPESGQIIMERGELYHAQCGDEEGEKALAILLAQKLIRVRTKGLESLEKRTINRNFGAVLLGIYQQFDEDRKSFSRNQDEILGGPTLTNIDRKLKNWLDQRRGVHHAALLDPRRHMILTCDSYELWQKLTQTSLLQTLVAPYFDESFKELDTLFSPNSEETQQTLISAGGRHYLLELVAGTEWVAALIATADMVSPGLLLTHMASLRQTIGRWEVSEGISMSPQSHRPRIIPESKGQTVPLSTERGPALSDVRLSSEEKALAVG